MTSAPSEDNPLPAWSKPLIWQSSPPFHIRWIVINETPFNYIGHLKNSFNEGLPVLVGKDGQEIEPRCGQALCELLDEDARMRMLKEEEPRIGNYEERGRYSRHEGYRRSGVNDTYNGRGDRGRGGLEGTFESSVHEENSTRRGEQERDAGHGGGSGHYGSSGPDHARWTGKVEDRDGMDWS